MTSPKPSTIPLTTEEEREIREDDDRGVWHGVDMMSGEIIRRLFATLDAERAARAEAEAKVERLSKQQHDDFVALSKLVWPWDTKHPARDTATIMMEVHSQFECGDCDKRCAFRYCEDHAPEPDCVEDATAKRIAEWLRLERTDHVALAAAIASAIERGNWRR